MSCFLQAATIESEIPADTVESEQALQIADSMTNNTTADVMIPAADIQQSLQIAEDDGGSIQEQLTDQHEQSDDNTATTADLQQTVTAVTAAD